MQKNNTTQIGGKGTMRHNKKRNILNVHNKQKKMINILIQNINLKLTYLNSEKKRQFTELVNNDLLNFLNNIKKEYIIKKFMTTEQIKNINIDFLSNIFFYSENKTIILLKDTIFDSINKYFTNELKKLSIIFIQMIDKLIKVSDPTALNESNKIDITNISKEYNKEYFDESLDYFDLNKDCKQHFSNIKNAYDKKISDSNKTICNMHFYRLQNQYENYLKIIY